MNLFFDFALMQRLDSLRPGFFPLRALQKITRLAVESTAEFIQNICPIHSRAVVVQPEEGGIADTRFLPQAVQRPSLLLKDCREPGNDHAGRIADRLTICQTRTIYRVYFTCSGKFSRLALDRRGVRPLGEQWKTTINFRARAVKAILGLSTFASRVSREASLDDYRGCRAPRRETADALSLGVSGRVPHRKIGRLVRFTEADLEEFVSKQRHPTSPQNGTVSSR